MDAKERTCNHKPWILLTVIFVVGAIVVSVVSHQNNSFDQDAVVAHQYEESSFGNVKRFGSDRNTDELELVSQEIGEKESQMEGSLILSDGAETEEQQIEMDRAAANEAERDDRVLLMNEKEDGEELDTKHLSKARHLLDNQDVHLELLSEEEVPAKHLKEDHGKTGCRAFRRCYATFCKNIRCTRVDAIRRNCKRKRVCRAPPNGGCRYIVRCKPQHYSYPRCVREVRRCGKICRFLTVCKDNVNSHAKFNTLCYNRYCVRRYCTRECTKDVKICKRYRRCYRRCVGECGKDDTECVHKCYHYQKCHHLNKCYDRCFVRRELCGNRCIYKTTSSSEAHYSLESKGKYGGNKKKKGNSSSEKKKLKKNKKSGEKAHPEEPKKIPQPEKQTQKKKEPEHPEEPGHPSEEGKEGEKNH